MSALIPIPDHLIQRLTARSRNLLDRQQLRSCQDLMALPTSDLFMIRGCGKKTVFELRQLQERIQMEFPHLFARSPAAIDLTVTSGETSSAATDGRGSPNAPQPGPAGWSILNFTLSDLFQLSASSPACRADWGGLSLPAPDLDRLRSVAIFPEDSAHLLCSVSIGYLLETGLSDSAISIMLCALARSSGLPGAALQSMFATNLSDASLYAGLPDDLLNPLVIPDFPFPALLDMGSRENCTARWRAVATITERTAVQKLGLSVTALRAIRYLWHLRERAISIAESVNAGMSTAAYGDFSELVDHYLEFAVAGKMGSTPCQEQAAKWRLLMRGRLRLINGCKSPLRELAKVLGVSGERVRQIESKLLAHLRNPATLKHLDYLWHLLDHFISSTGGARYVRELALSLQQMHGWKSPPTDEALASIMELSPNYQVVWDDPVRVRLKAPCCANCPPGTDAVLRAVEAAADGRLSFDHALEIMLSVCRAERCPELRKIAAFSNSIFQLMADSNHDFYATDEALRLKCVWSSQKSRKRDVLEGILLAAVDGLHFKEVLRRYSLICPDENTKAQTVHGRLDFFDWAVLWGQGTFRHRSFVEVPASLILEIQGNLVARLDSDDIPYLCLNGKFFDDYAVALRRSGIPNPQALYSCMRITGSATLTFEEYPYVLKKTAPRPKPQISRVLEDYILTRSLVVPVKEVREFALSKLGIPALQAPSHLRKNPNILHVGRLRVHISKVPAVRERLEKMIEGVPEQMRGARAAQERVFLDNLASCKEMGMTKPWQLASLLEWFLSDPGSNRSY